MTCRVSGRNGFYMQEINKKISSVLSPQHAFMNISKLINTLFAKKETIDANIPITHKTGEGLKILNLEFCGC